MLYTFAIVPYSSNEEPYYLTTDKSYWFLPKKINFAVTYAMI
jgi:hypothetical protein